MESFGGYASGEDRQLLFMELVGAEQIRLFILAERKIVQMEEPRLVVILEIGECDGFFFKLFQRFCYELNVLFFLFAAEKDDALEKGVVVSFIKQPLRIGNHKSRQADALSLQMMVEELA